MDYIFLIRIVLKTNCIRWSTSNHKQNPLLGRTLHLVCYKHVLIYLHTPPKMITNALTLAIKNCSRFLLLDHSCSLGWHNHILIDLYYSLRIIINVLSLLIKNLRGIRSFELYMTLGLTQPRPRCSPYFT